MRLCCEVTADLAKASGGTPAFEGPAWNGRTVDLIRLAKAHCALVLHRTFAASVRRLADEVRRGLRGRRWHSLLRMRSHFSSVAPESGLCAKCCNDDNATGPASSGGAQVPSCGTDGLFAPLTCAPFHLDEPRGAVTSAWGPAGDGAGGDGGGAGAAGGAVGPRGADARGGRLPGGRLLVWRAGGWVGGWRTGSRMVQLLRGPLGGPPWECTQDAVGRATPLARWACRRSRGGGWQVLSAVLMASVPATVMRCKHP